MTSTNSKINFCYVALVLGRRWWCDGGDLLAGRGLCRYRVIYRAPVPGPGWVWARKPVEDEADLTVGVRNIPGNTHVTPLHPRGDPLAPAHTTVKRPPRGPTLRRITNAALAAVLCPSTVEAARVLVKTTWVAVSRSCVTECGTRCSGRVGEPTKEGSMFPAGPRVVAAQAPQAPAGRGSGQGRWRILAPAPGGRHWGLQSEVAGPGAPRRRVSRRPHGHECARTPGAGAPNSPAGFDGSDRRAP